MDKNVKSAVQSGLYVIERNLNIILHKLGEEDDFSVMHSTVNDVDPNFAARIRAVIGSMFDDIELLKRTFELQNHQESARWAIRSHLSEIWTVLEECKPERLDGYGQLAEEESHLLEIHVNRLLENVSRMREELR